MRDEFIEGVGQHLFNGDGNAVIKEFRIITCLGLCDKGGCSSLKKWLFILRLVTSLVVKRKRSNTVVIAWAPLITLLHLSRARPTCKVSVPTNLDRGRVLSRAIEVIKWI
jgi:hypothetical protein